MGTINKAELKNNIVNAARIETARDSLPDQITNQVIPVIEVNPYPTKKAFIKDALINSGGATSTTMHTTAIDRDTFINSAQISIQKDVASNLQQVRILYTADGRQTQCISVRSLTLTADSKVATISFPVPLKCDRNTTIVLNIDATGAACTILAAVSLFEI